MVEIPEDIDVSARKLAMSIVGWESPTESRKIANAILAERQRCADACRRLSEHMKKRGQLQEAFTAGFIAQQIADGQHIT